MFDIKPPNGPTVKSVCALICLVNVPESLSQALFKGEQSFRCIYCAFDLQGHSDIELKRQNH